MTEYTADDFKKASFARRDGGCVAMRHGPYWVDSDDVSFDDLLTHGDMADAGWVPVQENPRRLTADDITDEMVKRVQQWAVGLRSGAIVYLGTEESVREMFAAALTPPPSRPEWVEGSPAVLAWHKSDGRTERNGIPGVKRIWSPDYRTTESWSTPSLRAVHWSDLVDVQPLGVRVTGAES